MSLRDLTHTDHDLLSEQELIDMYMREMCPNSTAIYAASQVSELLADSLGGPEAADLQKGLNLIEYMGHEGLRLEYGPMGPTIGGTIRDTTQKMSPMARSNMDLPISPKTTKSHCHNDSFSEMSDVASVDTCGKIRGLGYGRNSDSEPESESDFEETDSLMDCGGRMSPGPYDTATKFNLYKLLDSIQAHHLNISCGFQTAHSRLERLREQNQLDAVFLGKLNSSNERMRERTHEIRTEVTEIFHSLELIKKESSVSDDTPVTPLKVYPKKKYEYPFVLEPWTPNVVISGGVPALTGEAEKGPKEGSEKGPKEGTQKGDSLNCKIDDTEQLQSSEHDSVLKRVESNFTDTNTRLEPIDHSMAAGPNPLSIYPAGVSVLLVVLVGCWLFNWTQLMVGK